MGRDSERLVALLLAPTGPLSDVDRSLIFPNRGLREIKLALSMVKPSDGPLKHLIRESQMATLEPVYKYKGTHDIHGLVFGRAVTRISAF